MSEQNVSHEDALTIYENAPLPSRENRKAHPKEGNNKKYLKGALELAKLPKCNLHDPEEVRTRTLAYFEMCMENDLKPSLSGLALSLGTDRIRLWEAREKKTVYDNDEVSEILRQAVRILDTLMNDYMQNGEIQQIAGIFLMRNNFGYRNDTEITINPVKDPLGDITNIDELQRRYDEDMVPDA